MSHAENANETGLIYYILQN